MRIVGTRYGLPVAGFIAGFVSSAATTNPMGATAKSDLRAMKLQWQHCCPASQRSCGWWLS